MCPHGRILRHAEYGLWTRQIKMIGQRKTGRNAPYEWFMTPHMTLPQGCNSATQGLSLWVCLSVHPHIWYSFLLLRNTSLASLPFTGMEILFGKTEGQGPHQWPLGSYGLGSGTLTTKTQPRSGSGSPRYYRQRPPEVTLSPLPPAAGGLAPFLATQVMAAEPIDRDSWLSALHGARSRGWGSHSEQGSLPGFHSLRVSLWWRWETEGLNK